MIKKLLCLLLPAAMLLTTACSEDEVVNETPRPALVTPSSLTVGAAGGNCQFELNAEVSNVAVASNQSWCTAAVNGKTIAVTVAQNDKDATRIATLNVLSGETAVASVAVVQTRTELNLDAESELVSLNASDEEFRVGVLCDIDWTVATEAGWFTVTKDASEVVIAPQGNSEKTSRKGKFTITAGEIVKAFTVEQSGNSLTVADMSMSFSALEQTLSTKVYSGNVWKATTEDEWLTLSQEGNMLSVTASANDGEPRTGTVTVSAGDLKQVIKVSQKNVFQSLTGSWNLSGIAQTKVSDTEYTAQEANLGAVVITEKSAAQQTLSLDGYGKDYLATTTRAPFTIACDPETQTMTITTGETIGTFDFPGFPDPAEKATIKTVLVTYADGKFTLDTNGGATIAGKWNDDLTEVVFEANRGLYYGMWFYTSGEFSNMGCSRRMVSLVLKRDKQGEAAEQTAVQRIAANRCDR